MRVTPEEERYLNVVCKMALGLCGTQRPGWFLQELAEDLADLAWMSHFTREDAVPRATFILKEYSRMRSDVNVASHYGRRIPANRGQR